MNKYRDKSDFEISLCVAQIIFNDSEYDVIKQSMEVVKFQNGNGKGICHVFDPCNNPADAMPIINEYGISLIYQEGEFQFATNDGNYYSGVSNPLKAAMVIFLMIKDAEDE